MIIILRAINNVVYEKYIIFIINMFLRQANISDYATYELKAVEFIPEFAGKLSFYLSAVNDLIAHPTDICKSKNHFIAEYALKSINQPIGVSEYELTKLFPKDFKGSLPTIEEIEAELGD